MSILDGLRRFGSALSDWTPPPVAPQPPIAPASAAMAAASTPDYFPAAVRIILEAEGVFSDDKQDPGGATWYGIARASHPLAPWPPTKEQAVAIYRAEYWNAHRCGEMPWAWALCVFDAAVNQGARSIGMAQAALGVGIDGMVGPATLRAMASDDGGRLDDFMARRGKRYGELANFDAFGHGWLRRLFTVHRAAMKEP